jgi:hypothetical protein
MFQATTTKGSATQVSTTRYTSIRLAIPAQIVLCSTQPFEEMRLGGRDDRLETLARMILAFRRAHLHRAFAAIVPLQSLPSRVTQPQEEDDR